MTIKRDDINGDDIVALPSFWSFLMKVQLAAIVPVFLLGITWGTWVTVSLFEHDTDIALLERSMSKSPSSQSTNVNVGSSGAKMAGDAKTRREFYLTSEVALRESVSERTILEWISKGVIQPAPVKAGKEWQISADYRILPHHADDLRATVAK